MCQRNKIGVWRAVIAEQAIRLKDEVRHEADLATTAMAKADVEELVGTMQEVCVERLEAFKDVGGRCWYVEFGQVGESLRQCL